MCFNKQSSLAAFIIGIISSLVLIKVGSYKNKPFNYTVGTFFIFISMVQLMEYFMWSDISCTNNMNKMATMMGHLLIHLQPTLLFLLGYAFYKDKKSNVIITSINLIYFIYVMVNYFGFVNSDKLCTTVKNGHLDWPWKYNFNYSLYLLLGLINILYYFDSILGLILIALLAFFYFVSYKYFNTNTGELWCFFSISIPLILVFVNIVSK